MMEFKRQPVNNKSNISLTDLQFTFDEYPETMVWVRQGQLEYLNPNIRIFTNYSKYEVFPPHHWFADTDVVVGGSEDIKLIDEDVLSGMDVADREQGVLSMKRLRYYATKASTSIIRWDLSDLPDLPSDVGGCADNNDNDDELDK